jgi:cytochrome c peroxidase
MLFYDARLSKSQQISCNNCHTLTQYGVDSRPTFPGEKDPVTCDNMGKAIGAFERKLMTPARWDQFLRGDQNALTPAEKAGFNEFISAGCHTCHAGALLGGNMLQKIGAVKPWPDAADPGRYRLTRNEADHLMFKVSSLRNIEKTAPYFHDGKTPTLREAIAKMGEYQVGKTLSDTQIQSIQTWMASLTGEIPAEYIKEPVLPKSTSKTPKPIEAD